MTNLHEETQALLRGYAYCLPATMHKPVNGSNFADRIAAVYDAKDPRHGFYIGYARNFIKSIRRNGPDLQVTEYADTVLIQRAKAQQN